MTAIFEFLQDGKNPLKLPFAGPGSPAIRLMSKQILAPPSGQNVNPQIRPLEPRVHILPSNVKSSPISESESPLPGTKFFFSFSHLNFIF